MLILTIIVIGMFAGWLAHLIVERDERTSWGRLFAVGIAGSFVGGTLFNLVTGDGFAITPSGLVGSIVGAIVLLGVMRFF